MCFSFDIFLGLFWSEVGRPARQVIECRNDDVLPLKVQPCQHLCCNTAELQPPPPVSVEVELVNSEHD